MWGARRRRDVVALSFLVPVVLALTIWRIAFVLAGPDLDTDAYGHHAIARRLADHPFDLSAHWVWLPLFHYLQALAVRAGATLQTIRFFDTAIAAATPCLLYVFLRRGRRCLRADHDALEPNEEAKLDDDTPLIAALLCALSPIAMQMGTTGQTEPLFAFGTLGCIALLDAKKITSATVVLTALVLFRYEAWAIIPAILVCMIGNRFGNRLANTPRRSDVAEPSSLSTAVVLPTLAILAWAALRRPEGGGRWFWFLHATRDFANDAQGIHGAFDRSLGQLAKDVVYYPVLVPFACLGWPLLLAPLGVIRTWRRQGNPFFIVYLCILGFLGFAWITRSSLGLYRHLVVLIPFYCTLIANGIVTLGRGVQRALDRQRSARRALRTRSLLIARSLVTLLAVGAMLLTYRMLDGWMADWRDKARTYFPDRRAIALYLRTTPEESRIFCDEPMIEVLSGVDRRRFERAPLTPDEATRARVQAAASRDGEAWVASYPSHLASLRSIAEVKLPHAESPRTNLSEHAGRASLEAILLRIPSADVGATAP